jgi:hypothetical protein
MIKFWPLAARASPIQRWSYVAPSAMSAAWATLQSGTFALIVTQRKAGVSALPAAVAPLLAAFVTAIGLGVLWVRPSRATWMRVDVLVSRLRRNCDGDAMCTRLMHVCAGASCRLWFILRRRR